MTTEPNTSVDSSSSNNDVIHWNNYVPEMEKMLPHSCSFDVFPINYEYENRCFKAKARLFPQHNGVGSKSQHRTKSESCIVSYLSKYQEKKFRSAINTNNSAKVTKLLEDGVNPNSQDKLKRSGLHLASSRGYIEIVEILLAWGADPNVTDVLGNTPLHLAACTNNINMIYILLRGGTNIRSINNNGRNPLDIAKSKLLLMSHKFFKNDAQVPLDITAFISDISKITKLMICYLNMTNHKENIQDLESISDKLETINISTNDATNEIGNLLNDLETLSL